MPNTAELQHIAILFGDANDRVFALALPHALRAVGQGETISLHSAAEPELFSATMRNNGGRSVAVFVLSGPSMESESFRECLWAYGIGADRALWSPTPSLNGNLSFIAVVPGSRISGFVEEARREATVPFADLPSPVIGQEGFAFGMQKVAQQISQAIGVAPIGERPMRLP